LTAINRTVDAIAKGEKRVLLLSSLLTASMLAACKLGHGRGVVGARLILLPDFLH
jgi:hypothetical protein